MLYSRIRESVSPRKHLTNSRLIVWVDDMERLEYVSVVARGSTVSPDDHGIVAVIDGSMYSSAEMKTLALMALQKT